MPYCCYPTPEGWQAQSQAGWNQAEGGPGGGPLALNLFVILLKEEASPALTLISPCYRVFKFR